MEELKDEADLRRRSPVSAASARFEVIRPGDLDLAGSGEIHRAAEIQQGGLAAAAPPYQRSDLARPAFQRNVPQSFDPALINFRNFADRIAENNLLTALFLVYSGLLCLDPRDTRGCLPR